MGGTITVVRERARAWSLAGAFVLGIAVQLLPAACRGQERANDCAANGRSDEAQVEDAVRPDYFVSIDTVIIGCTAGAAAGLLVGSVPVAGAALTGVGLPESVILAASLAGMGCGVGAASGGVAVLTAWMLGSP